MCLYNVLMTSVYPYDKKNNNSEWLNQLNNDNIVDNIIDHFFTQRKVVEYEEIIDEKTLDRKTIKHNCIFNFLAINFPITSYFKNLDKFSISVEIWGDEKFNFKGTITKEDGEVPHLLLKLKEDKMIFIKLIFIANEKIIKTFITFIPVIKRYQSIPELINDTP